jgi:hypothetical protein
MGSDSFRDYSPAPIGAEEEGKAGITNADACRGAADPAEGAASISPVPFHRLSLTPKSPESPTLPLQLSKQP